MDSVAVGSRSDRNPVASVDRPYVLVRVCGCGY